jgi:UDP-N-acetylglucosamine--N-acetylmuramyl-(pentapeptide) pyrophosphoryl-undecaprenol N-acetylglucosamine transferase
MSAARETRAGGGETYVIAGGGTGGHLYPGIAIAEELLRRRQAARIVFAGRGLPLERAIVERQGYQLVAVRSGGVVGKSPMQRMKGAFLALRGVFEAMALLGRLRPRVVIGVGGYASGPVVLAAAARRIPTLIQEQNAVPGLTNRLLSRVASAIAITFDDTRRYFGGRGVTTGNPIRAEFASVPRRRRMSRFEVLIFGGSQGARALNNAMFDALPLLAPVKTDLRVVHGTGESDAERAREIYSAAGIQAEVRPYINDILDAYVRANLVVARSGASTCSELAACGRASILVPLPTSAHDHQKKNAERLAERGAALLMEEKGLTGASLAAAILALIRDPERVAAMETAAVSLARPDAAARIVDLVARLAW